VKALSIGRSAASGCSQEPERLRSAMAPNANSSRPGTPSLRRRELHYAVEAGQYDAEEVGVVLKGKLELTIDSEKYVLGPGDAYYFDNNRRHRFRNAGRGVLMTISVNTPTHF